MAAGQGGGGGNNGTGSGTGTAPGSGAAGLGIPAHLTLSFSSGPHWGAAALPQSHTVRSLERALEEAGSSGILCLSGRKLRDFPGSGCDLSDTTQAGEGALAARGRGCGRAAGPLRARRRGRGARIRCGGRWSRAVAGAGPRCGDAAAGSRWRWQRRLRGQCQGSGRCV